MPKSKYEEMSFAAYEDMFETDESRADAKRERIMEISISDIFDFPDHPYKVNEDDEAMVQLVDSVKSHGLLHPVIVRPLEDGKFQMVSGHRRKKAFEIAGIDKMPCRVMDISFDEAVLIMVDSNLQRERVLPSEKAFAYKMRLEAMKRQGMRTDLTSAPVEQKLAGKTSREMIAEQVGESHAQIQRYIRLTNLIPELLDLIDEEKIKMRPAVELSYLTDEQQYWLLDSIESQDATPSHAQAIRIRKLAEAGELTEDNLDDIMCEEKGNQKEKFIIRDEKVFSLIPDDVSMTGRQEYVLEALDFYKKLPRDNNGNKVTDLVPESVPAERKQGYVIRALNFYKSLPNISDEKQQEFVLNAVKFYQQHIERQKKNRDAR